MYRYTGKKTDENSFFQQKKKEKQRKTGHNVNTQKKGLRMNGKHEEPTCTVAVAASGE